MKIKLIVWSRSLQNNENQINLCSRTTIYKVEPTLSIPNHDGRPPELVQMLYKCVTFINMTHFYVPPRCLPPRVDVDIYVNLNSLRPIYLQFHVDNCTLLHYIDFILI